MTDETNRGRLSRGVKAALLDAMRKAPVGDRPVRGSVVPRASRHDMSFESLPAYQQMQTQRALADALKIGFPFYRAHDVRAGARSVINGKPVVNFASYDYLGFNGRPEITKAVVEAAETWGTSVSASRITAGERQFHRDLERAIADIYDAEDSLVFVSGHATAISTIAALLGPKDLILHDSLVHNCVVVGAQLCGAMRRAFPHNDMKAASEILAATRDRFERVLIVSEGLYSMDGDGPDLARLTDIKEQFDCWLMVDDAHALGVLGKTGRGIFEMAGVDPKRVDIWFGTLSKTLVSCGGYVAGNRALVDYLKLAAPGMVYSVGLPAPAAVAALTAIGLMRREPERVARLQTNGQLFLRTAREAGLDVGTSWGYAVTPVILGDSLRTVLLAERLLNRGYNVFPIVPPGVPERSARLRFFISSEHTSENIEGAVAATREELTKLEREGISLSKMAKLITAAVKS
ncbi:MAG TPA: aminotransferase class I/II-fold pyridoxal phosphate-dependent enzyme [Stellaceae bacterium]|nr:aminotransferase class I/II-fold pyridoxal phosphate-dependent enzyme [Stellaceae bacterium]HMD63073.1 aminotransferase class I/II-fold pyridoxal phosphate-dependent enzyme [Stellaceae bacterium]